MPLAPRSAIPIRECLLPNFWSRARCVLFSTVLPLQEVYGLGSGSFEKLARVVVDCYSDDGAAVGVLDEGTLPDIVADNLSVLGFLARHGVSL